MYELDRAPGRGATEVVTMADDRSQGSTRLVAELEREEHGPRQLVVVPRSPGPLYPLDAGRRPEGDELDEIIEDVFGPTTDERPGAFDVALIIVGVGLIAWSWISGGGFWLVLGLVVLVLGVALPARSLVQAGRSRRVARREQQILAGRRALDISDPTVGLLADSYDTLLDAAQRPDVRAGTEAIEAGHAAIQDVASLLEGGTPLSDAERRYVERRTKAIRDLAAQLIRTSRAGRRASIRDDAGTAAEIRRRAAVARARVELEATTGVGAVEDMERLRARLQVDGPADGAQGDGT